MDIYMIKLDRMRYKELRLDQHAYLDFIPDHAGYTYEQVMRFGLYQIALGSWWRLLDAEFVQPVDEPEKEVPDLSLWAEGTMVLASHAAESLESILAPYGEFLPIRAHGDPFYLFNCLTFVEQEERWKREVVPEEGVDGGGIRFDEEVTDDQPVFKTIRDGGSNLYCNEEFRQEIIRLGLTGVRFSRDFNSPF